MELKPLLKKDSKIVEKKKIFFIIPLCVILIAVVAMCIYGPVLGTPVNLGMDFAGGYTLQIKLGAKLTEENADEYKAVVGDIIENYSDENGDAYGIDPKILKTGSGDDTSLYVKYKAVADDAKMEEINKGLIEALNERVTKIIPTVTVNGAEVTLIYPENVSTYEKIIGEMLTEAGVAYSGLKATGNSAFTFNVSGTVDADALKTALSIPDFYAGVSSLGSLVSGSVSTDMLVRAGWAIIVSLILMLIYICIRFEFASGVATVIALFHDMIVMTMLTILFHIELNATFIAAVVTILGYSINNTIIVFDRVRENIKIMGVKNSTAAQIVNRSISETFVRSVNTTITTFIMIGSIALVCAIGGITDLVTFALPIMFGLIAGAFSSICIAPSIWELMRRNNLSKTHIKNKTKQEPDAKEASLEKQAN